MARSVTYGDLVEGQRPNLPCISEEAMEVTNIINLSTMCQDINFPEKLLEELECLDNITSCNKVALTPPTLILPQTSQVENYLLFSEFQQPMEEEGVEGRSEVGVERRGRRSNRRFMSGWQVALPKRRVSTIVENSV